MPGIGNLDRGAYAGREAHVYYDSVIGSYSDPPTEDATWVEIKRIRNFVENDNKALTNVSMHGNTIVGAVPGERTADGSFEYVLSRAADTVYDYLVTKQRAGTPIYIRVLNDLITVNGAKGEDFPIILGEKSVTRNNNDEVVASFTWSFADVFDYNGDSVVKTAVTISV